MIETERLRLRGFGEADLDPVASFWADEAAARFVGGTKTRDEAWRVIALYLGHWEIRGYGPLAVEEKASGDLVGWTGCWFPSGWPEPEILWSLLPAFGGNGYATEAARAARAWAYRDLGWTTAISLIDPNNRASAGVAERLGATHERDVTLRFGPVGMYRHPAADLADRCHGRARTGHPDLKSEPIEMAGTSTAMTSRR